MPLVSRAFLLLPLLVGHPLAASAQVVRAAVRPSGPVSGTAGAATVGVVGTVVPRTLGLPGLSTPGLESRLPSQRPAVTPNVLAVSAQGRVGMSLLASAQTVERPVTGITAIVAGRVAAQDAQRAAEGSPAEQWLETAPIVKESAGGARDWGHRSFSELLGARTASSRIFDATDSIAPRAVRFGSLAAGSAHPARNPAAPPSPPQSKKPVQNRHVPFLMMLTAAALAVPAALVYGIRYFSDGPSGMMTAFMEYWPLFPWAAVGLDLISRIVRRHRITGPVIDWALPISMAFWTGVAVLFGLNTEGLIRILGTLLENWYIAVGAAAAAAMLLLIYEHLRYGSWPFARRESLAIGGWDLSSRGFWAALGGAASGVLLSGLFPLAPLVMAVLAYLIAAFSPMDDSKTLGDGQILGFIIGTAAMVHTALLGWPYSVIGFFPALAAGAGWFIEAYRR